MTVENQFNQSNVDASTQNKMEEIWRITCGSWENCSQSNIQNFLSQCEEVSIDPQYCLNWIIEHSDQIPNWASISNNAREWVIDHTSTGNPVEPENQQ
ncbi:hypothetical protein J2S74_002042 [Evansella vedderi]|uniref:Uncharacterized protein n=1 Tax=Evansella vedderi TaxID=38282 RepID=A0ABT9ZW14_9BACI|nr:hypothetical protein [Evansella vedderi]MDQ0254663.1 hypothetical protein [Evansella vedderi]